MTNAVQVQDIDPLAPGLAANERAMLMDLIKAREAYCLQGRGREYHAMGKALMVVWHYMQTQGRPPRSAAHRLRLARRHAADRRHPRRRQPRARAVVELLGHAPAGHV